MIAMNVYIKGLINPFSGNVNTISVLFMKLSLTVAFIPVIKQTLTATEQSIFAMIVIVDLRINVFNLPFVIERTSDNTFVYRKI